MAPVFTSIAPGHGCPFTGSPVPMETVGRRDRPGAGRLCVVTSARAAGSREGTGGPKPGMTSDEALAFLSSAACELTCDRPDDGLAPCFPFSVPTRPRIVLPVRNTVAGRNGVARIAGPSIGTNANRPRLLPVVGSLRDCFLLDGCCRTIIGMARSSLLDRALHTGDVSSCGMTHGGLERVPPIRILHHHGCQFPARPSA